jgi:hypothetical protein
MLLHGGGQGIQGRRRGWKRQFDDWEPAPVSPTEKDEMAKVKEIYLQKHPDAFWVDFGDFFWNRMEVEHVRFIGGFAWAGSVSAEDYTAAANKPDPIMAFRGHVVVHINTERERALVAESEM